MKLYLVLLLMLTGCAVAVEDDPPPPTGTFQGSAADAGQPQGTPLSAGCTYIFGKDHLPIVACLPPGAGPLEPFPTRGDPPPIETGRQPSNR